MCDLLREIHSDKTHQRQYVFILCYKPCSCISIREIIRWWDTVVRSRPSNCDTSIRNSYSSHIQRCWKKDETYVRFRLWLWVMVFNITFNNISVVSWLSVLLGEETRVPVENHQPIASHWQILSHNVVSSTLCHEQGSNSQI